MPVCLIAAVASNGTIGNDYNEMPWEPLIEDLKNFRDATTGNIVVMGARTFESLNCMPLPNRKNVVFTRRIKPEYPTKGVVYYKTEVDFLNDYDVVEDDIFIIGGASIYANFLPIADSLLITEIHKDYQGKIKFPHFNKNEWIRDMISSEQQGDVKFDFIEYSRKVL